MSHIKGITRYGEAGEADGSSKPPANKSSRELDVDVEQVTRAYCKKKRSAVTCMGACSACVRACVLECFDVVYLAWIGCDSLGVHVYIFV